jgi:Transposase DDE domain group 1
VAGTHAPGLQPRYVVTSLRNAAWDARALYKDLYCARGEAENRIGEQFELFADRASCETMASNQLRLMFSSFAYVLMEALRRIALRHTQFAGAAVNTIRLKLLKIGALIRTSVRRIHFAMASASPNQTEFEMAHIYLRRAFGSG